MPAELTAAHPPSIMATPPTPPPDPPMDIDTDDKEELVFEYEMENWSAIEEPKKYSPYHYFAGFKWRLLVFPKGNQIDTDVSVYLECGGPAESPVATLAADQRISLDPNADAGTNVPSELSVDRPDTAAERQGDALPPISQDGNRDALMDPEQKDRSADVDLSVTVSEAKADVDELDTTMPVTKPAKPPPVQTEVPVAVQSQKSKDPAVPAPPSQPWIRPARFWLTLKPCAPNTRLAAITKETSHSFREREADWGFREFCSIVRVAKDGFEDENGSIHIGVRIKLEDASPDTMFNPGTYDSRAETGYVGFKNQGATCYMNSLLQTLYTLGSFRKAVFHMPVPDPADENAGGSEMSYALQKVFYDLQHSTTAVKTKKLTESFGWDNTDAFTQHDVQELNRIMCDHLEERMKKITPNERNTISELFEGKILNYIECVNVDYKSTREESFYDVSLNVKGCRNIFESFDKYCEVETMDGENKYQADGFEELQEARKGVKFLRLPPVLQLHLKRFEYDFQRDAMVKINDRFEYATEIDLSPYVDNSDGTDIYVLHSVLVHVGDVNGGHYYAYIRPSGTTVAEHDTNPPAMQKKPSWFKFDDDMVTTATEESAVVENFGSGGERDTSNLTANARYNDDLMNANADLNGMQAPPHTMYQQPRVRNYGRRISNAYMLQYVRRDMVTSLLIPPTTADFPVALKERVESEEEEERRRKEEHAEQHLYMHLAVATCMDMADHHGVDLVDWSKVRQIRVKRAMRLKELKALLKDEGLTTDENLMRLWKCDARRNDSIRPESLLAEGKPELPIAEPPKNTRSIYHQSYNNGYQRYGYQGNEEVMKLYVEDFLSPFCFGAGKRYSMLAAKYPQIRSASAIDRPYGQTVPVSGDVNSRGNAIAERNFVDNVVPGAGIDHAVGQGFELVGGEMILFFKRYTPYPVPKLNWIGHCIMNRGARVRDIVPTLREAATARREYDDFVPLHESGILRLYEEWSADKTSLLDLDKTFEAQEIPVENGKGGDIVVFMDGNPVNPRKKPVVQWESLGWDGKADEGSMLASAYDPSLPLGGRPLTTAVDYYRYLMLRVKVEFKDRTLDYSTSKPEQSIVLELLRYDRYPQVRAILALALGNGSDPNQLRLFPHDLHRDGPALEAVRNADDEELQRMLPSQSLTALNLSDLRTLWYERTEFPISEYDNKEEVRVMWRHDGGTQATPHEGLQRSSEVSPSNAADSPDAMTDIAPSPDTEDSTSGMNGKAEDTGVKTEANGGRSFSILVPVASRYSDVLKAVKERVKAKDEEAIRLMEVREFRVARFIDLSDAVSRQSTWGAGLSEYGTELRAEPISDDEIVSAGRPDLMPVSVSHLVKDTKSRTWKTRSYFGVPIVIRVTREGETVGLIREHIRQRLRVAQEVFSTWKLVEVSQSKISYLEDLESIWSPDNKSSGGVELTALAVEHHGSVPAKRPSATTARFADKPLKIRG